MILKAWRSSHATMPSANWGTSNASWVTVSNRPAMGVGGEAASPVGVYGAAAIVNAVGAGAYFDSDCQNDTQGGSVRLLERYRRCKPRIRQQEPLASARGNCPPFGRNRWHAFS